MNVDEHIKRGDIFARSLFFGSITPEQGATISILCEEGNTSIGEWMSAYNIVHDRPAMKADAMVAGFLGHGGKVKIVERSADKASATLTLGENSHTFALTWDEIQNEPYTWIWDKKQNKRVRNPKYETPVSRRQMLWARMISDAVRTVDPTVNGGIYTPEEVEGFDDTKDTSTTNTPAPAGEKPPKATRPDPKPEPTPAPVEPKSEATPAPAPAPEATDYSAMPVGSAKGTPFSSMPLKHLAVIAKAIGKTPGLTEDYRPAIEAAIAAAKEASNE